MRSMTCFGVQILKRISRKGAKPPREQRRPATHQFRASSARPFIASFESALRLCDFARAILPSTRFFGTSFQMDVG